MRKNYTQEEIVEIRLAFDGSHGQGLISKIINSEKAKDWPSNISPQELANLFTESNANGVARLINTLNNMGEKRPKELGSHSIDFYGVTGGPFSFENARSLVGITIGNQRENISPTAWLSYLARGFSSLSDIQKSAFSDVCDDFAKLQEFLTSGEGFRKIPLGEFFDI